jgi:hypothetical protein
MPASWQDAYESVVPGFFPEALQSGRVFAGILGLVLYKSAVIAEIMRAGILSLDRGQGEAAASLGLTYPQQMRHVILPQGLPRMVPATVSTHHAQQRHDAREHHRHRRGHAARPHPLERLHGLRRRCAGALLQVFVFIGLLFVVTNLAALEAPPARGSRAQAHRGPGQRSGDQLALAVEARQ